MGGMLMAIEKGYIQQEIQESAYRYQKQVETKEQIVVGLNEYSNEEEKIKFELVYPPEELEKNQVGKLHRLKEERSNEQVKSRLGSLRQAIEIEKNLFPLIIEAVKAKATLGEISGVLEESYGTFKENIHIQ